MTRLPDFRLETYFSRWEFTARHHLTASDAQTMTLAELLALADDQDRDAFENLSLGYTETFGDPALREAIAADLRAGRRRRRHLLRRRRGSPLPGDERPARTPATTRWW